jgi:endogenous inhibitor of DNA gyrase (YacG/DUF329 family)
VNPPVRRTVPCPGCGRPAEYSEANRWRPFCSERCRLGDLGAWASERFRVPAEAPTDEDGAPPER